MPYRVTLRSTATVELEADRGNSNEDFYAAIRAQVPDGYELTGASRVGGKGTARSTQTRETTIESRDELWTCAGDGWQALNLIAVS